MCHGFKILVETEEAQQTALAGTRQEKKGRREKKNDQA